MANKLYTLITGGSHGIGRALAEECARHGESLILVARDETQLRQVQQHLQEQFSVSVVPLRLDLTETDAIEQLQAKLHKMNASIHTLINNAGFGDYGPFAQADSHKLTAMIDLNVRALTDLTRALLPGMLERKSGRILNLASVAAFIPGPNMAVYFATKAYVLSFSEALAEELRGTGITVTTLCPGPTKTEFAQHARAQKTQMFQNSESVETIASLGYRSMVTGKRVVLPSARYRVLLPFSRLFPSEWVTSVLRRTNR